MAERNHSAHLGDTDNTTRYCFWHCTGQKAHYSKSCQFPPPPYTQMSKLALLHQFLTYSRFTALKEVPAGYFPGKATGDGNCFYNSVSLLLHGSEELASWLRLGSAVWAALHLQHYLQAVSNTHIYPCSGSRCRLHTYM